MSKIKYYKNINLEEFLDEKIKECTEDEIESNKEEINNNLQIEFDKFVDMSEGLDIEIVESDELESDITFEITKIKGKKKLVLTVNIYDDSEIIKLDFEIKKSTLKKLLKDLED